jgi:hypothetical protein
MKFWHVATGKEIFTLGPPNPVHSFLFSPMANTWRLRGPPKSREDGAWSWWRAPSFEEIITAEKVKAGKNKNQSTPATADHFSPKQ